MIKLNLSSISTPLIENLGDENKMQFDLNIADCNTNFAKRFLKSASKINVIGVEAYYATPIGSNLICLIENDRVVFLLQFEEHERSIKTGNNFAVSKYIVQKLVWQDSKYCKGFARKLMTYFLTQYDYIETSESQFPRGILMWKRFIGDNIGKLYIYIVLNGKYIQIKNTLQFESLYRNIWGTHKIHESTKIIASTKSLKR